MEESILLFIVVGFLAQLIDGALGMAYGVSSNAFLLSIGVSPVVSSAGVHMAEVFTTMISGFSHFKMGNVDKLLLKKLILPGVFGGIIGAYILTSVPVDIIKPVISVYLLLMGIRIIYKALRNISNKNFEDSGKYTILALFGGFFDAIGGGGWGPIVTTTLVANGHSPRYTIGSVNLSEFFVTTAEAITFIALINFIHWKVILGLIIGGVIAAPFAAILCKRLPSKVLMFVVGIIIILLSIRTIYYVII